MPIATASICAYTVQESPGVEYEAWQSINNI